MRLILQAGYLGYADDFTVTNAIPVRICGKEECRGSKKPRLGEEL